MRTPDAPAASRFYVTGGTLPAGAPSYVERQADRELLAALHAAEYCYALNTRQMGKSSLMVRAAARLRAEGFTVAVLDLTAIGQNLTPEQWYGGLLGRLGRQLDREVELEAFWEAHPGVGPLQRWMMALQDVVLRKRRGQVVIFVDEIDAVRSLPFSADEFFAAIRECYTRRAEDPEFGRLTFCLLGVATPSDLIRDTRMSPFNIGRRVQVTDFTPEEALPLAAMLPGREATLSRVLRWTGGNPYMTQRLCEAVSEAGDAGQVDALCSSLFLTRAASEADDNLAFVRNRLLRNEADLASLLDLYGKVQSGRRVPDDETNPLCGILKLSGAVTEAGGFLKVRNRIYDQVFDRHWVRDHMPDAELRRQRSAYRRGLLRAGAVASAILLVVAALAGIAVRNGRAALEREREMRRLLYASDMVPAQQAVDSNLPKRARALLEAHIPRPGQEDLRTFEWRYLWRRSRDQSLFTSPDQESPVFSLAFSRDGRRLATGLMDGRVRLWDAASRRVVATLNGHRDQTNVAFSPDGRTLATASRDSAVRLWDTATGREKGQLPALPDLNMAPLVQFSPDGRLLLINEFSSRVSSARISRLLTLWDLAAQRQAWQLPGVYPCAFCPDGRTLVAGAGKTIQLWDVAGRRERAEHRVAPSLWKKGPWFSPDGKTLAVIAADQTIRIVRGDVQQDWAIRQGPGRHVVALSFSPDGRTLACANDDGTLQLWDLATRQPRVTLRGHTNVIYDVAFSPDGRTLATACKDGTLKFWDPGARDETDALNSKRVENSMHPPRTLSPDGRTMALMDLHGATLLDAVTLRPIGRIPMEGAGTQILGFTSGSRTLLTTTSFRDRPDANRLTWWDLATGREIGALPLGKVGAGLVELSADGSALAAVHVEDGSMSIWDVDSRREVRRMVGVGRPWSLSLSPDRRTLAVGTMPDRCVRLWDAATGQERRPPLAQFRDAPVTSAFSPDGRLLAVGNYMNDVVVWDTRSPERPLISFASHGEAPKALAFSPDGQTLATGGDDGLVRLWNVRTWRLTLTLSGHQGAVLSIQFSPDGARLYTSDVNGTVRIWRADAVESGHA
jgi:WD40 repeat protein